MDSIGYRTPIHADQDSPTGMEAGTVPPGRSRFDIRGSSKIHLSQHYRRPHERPFLASDREKATILVGGLTHAHERFIQATFQGCGYRCEVLPTPDQTAFHVGKEYGNNGQCSPAYFTAGSLIQFLKDLETRGMSRSEIADKYIFFTAGGCGPCRFGMYAAEYRLALQNAGFDGFRVVRFQQNQGVEQQMEQPGLKYTLNFGMGMLKALYLGDALNDIACNVRPYEVKPGETDRAIGVCIDDLCEHLRTWTPDGVFDKVPGWLRSLISKGGLPAKFAEAYPKVHEHLHGQAMTEVLARCRERISNIEVDRLRVKPIVKIIGEFWAQTTEGDGNYRMFEFLENEGAQVQTEPIGTWLTYLLAHARLQMQPRRGLDGDYKEPGKWDLRQRVRIEMSYQKKRLLLSFAEWYYADQYHRLTAKLGGTAHKLLPQDQLARLADPFYKPLARGGEGYLEVAKNIYYNLHKLCHMVLSLKPFGCMPSSQSDGVQSAVMSRFKDMIFLPIETSGEGEINAHSRAQMALGEAKVKAKMEFQDALSRTGRKLDDIRVFVARHPELRNPLYALPHHNGWAGVAANFVSHVSDRMNGGSR